MDTQSIVGIIGFLTLAVSIIGINIKIYQLFGSQIKEIERVKLLSMNTAEKITAFKKDVKERGDENKEINKENKSEAKENYTSLKQEVNDLKTKQSDDMKEIYSSIKKDLENLNEKYLEVIMKNYNK